MGATINDIPFRVDPYMVSWTFSPKVRADKTIGGKVVQVYGVELGPLNVQGAFGIGGWEEQSDFLDRMKELADQQLDHYPVDSPQPHRFTWHEQGWDMLVWLMAFSQVGASSSIEMTNEIINPKWSLTFKIVEDNSGLKQVAADEYLSRIAAGLGWHQTEFNGPLDPQQALAEMQQVGATNVRDFLNIAFGIGTNVTGGNVSSGGGVGLGGSLGGGASSTPVGDIQQYAAQKAQSDYGWGPDQFQALNEIVTHESSWNPDAQNPHSTAYGLFQFLDTTWAGVGGTKTSDWKTQVDLGLKYIFQRYGDPKQAWAFWSGHGWY